MTGLGMVRVALWGLVIIALFAAGAFTALRYFAPERSSVLASGAPLGEPFRLVDHNGAEVTEAIFRDRPAAVFFGFTHCPDVCPTTLFEMTQWIAALGPDAAKMRFVFVTVDPERDSPAAIKAYLSAFSPDVVGVSGSPADVEAMLKSYHVYFSKVPLEGGDYTMDHTASVFLLDQSGALTGTIGRQESRETAVAKLKRLVAG